MQMRHADARVTLEVYGHVVGDAQRQAVEKVGELVCPKAAETTPKCAQTEERQRAESNTWGTLDVDSIPIACSIKRESMCCA